MADAKGAAPAAEEMEAAQEWDEGRIRASLARIEQLQDQLDALRSIIPSITAAAANQGGSKATYFKQFSNATVGGSAQLEQFKSDWKDKRTQEIFEKARARREADGDIRLAVGVPKYGWIEEADGGSALDGGGEPEDIKQVTESWKEEHPDLQVELEDNDRRVNVQYTTGPYRLRFIITRDAGDSWRQVYRVSCSGAKPIYAVMERCLALRPHPDRLSETLDMLAAYSNLPAAQCAACNRLLDRQGAIPAARRLKQSTSPQAEVDKSVKWDALHESCLPR